MGWLDAARQEVAQQRGASHTALLDARVIVVRHADLDAVRAVDAACAAQGVSTDQRYAAMEATRWLTAHASSAALPVSRELALQPTQSTDADQRSDREDALYIDAWRLFALVCRSTRPWYRRGWTRAPAPWHRAVAAIIAGVLEQQGIAVTAGPPYNSENGYPRNMKAVVLVLGSVGLLGVGTSSLVHTHVVARQPQRVYAVADVATDLTRDPDAWSGRVVTVRGDLHFVGGGIPNAMPLVVMTDPAKPPITIGRFDLTRLMGLGRARAETNGLLMTQRPTSHQRLSFDHTGIYRVRLTFVRLQGYAPVPSGEIQ